MPDNHPDIITMRPSWLVRWGSVLACVITVIAIAGAGMIEYPETTAIRLELHKGGESASWYGEALRDADNIHAGQKVRLVIDGDLLEGKVMRSVRGHVLVTLPLNGSYREGLSVEASVITGSRRLWDRIRQTHPI